jgi:TolB-like protein
MKNPFIALLLALTYSTCIPADINAQVTNKNNNVAIAAKAPAINSIVVLPFVGPKIIDVDVDELWKIKTGYTEPMQGELSRVNKVMQECLIEKLKDKYGPRVANSNELDQALSSISLTNNVGKYAQIRKALQARYVIEGTIDKIEFDGNTVLKDDYILTISLQVVDTSTGRIIWSESLKKFANELSTRKLSKSVTQVFTDIQVPDAAEYLTNRLTSDIAL